MECDTRPVSAGTYVWLIASHPFFLVSSQLCLCYTQVPSPGAVSCSYAFLGDVYLPPLELLEGMVTHMAGMAAKRVPPAAAAAMLHYCTSLGVLPPAPASALFSYVHKCAPAAAPGSGHGRNASRANAGDTKFN